MVFMAVGERDDIDTADGAAPQVGRHHVFANIELRTRLVKALGTSDYVIAVLEDLVAIGGSLWVVSRF